MQCVCRYSRCDKTGMDTHTDQVMIAGSLLLGFWLIAKSIYLIIT